MKFIKMDKAKNFTFFLQSWEKNYVHGPKKVVFWDRRCDKQKEEKIEMYGQVKTLRRRRVERMFNRIWTLCG